MRQIAIILFTTILSLPAIGHDQVDLFDVAPSANRVKALGVPTKAEVDALERRVNKLFHEGNCEAALEPLQVLAKRADYLADLINNGLEPYYGTGFDGKKSFKGDRTALLEYKKLSNNYMQKRNIAFAMFGECLMKLDRPEEAVPVLVKTLDLIEADNPAWWDRSRANLYSIIGVE